MTQPLHTPAPATVEGCQLSAFSRFAASTCGRSFASYDDLWRWSVDEPESFWMLLWRFCEVTGDSGVDAGGRVLEDADQMPGARWFPQARLNYAENLLHAPCLSTLTDEDSLVFCGESRARSRWTRTELKMAVSRTQQALQQAGVIEGDRVAGFLPNIPESIVFMLAAVSLGAIWSSASPDFGVQGVLDRFGQIKPKVLFCIDHYWYNGKRIDCMTKNAEVAARLFSLAATVVTPYPGEVALNDKAELDISAIPQAVTLDDFVAPFSAREISFNRVPFAHPLFIMFSSGTTGVPKCIVHGHGGSLLQHLKEHRLHGDMRPGDRFFYFTTCGWMMWNWLCSGLGSGATLLLYDGSPFVAGADGRDGTILFDYADAEAMTHFGTSAKFIDALAKHALSPRKSHRLDTLRVMYSTGSPLSPESFDYVYREIKEDLLLASICGGTDILSCFVGGVPTLPVYRGEIQRAGLGMASDVYSNDGHPVREEKGELVCSKPFPAMPVSFWNDPDGTKYKAAYFERFNHIWYHGDFAEITANGGYVIHGRSDATLNPGGVRIGTAEIYRQVEQLPEIVESLVIGQNYADDVRIVLFVKLQDNVELDEMLAERIRLQIRNNTTPRHVPAKILSVGDIPRTKSGKIVELAVRQVVHGEMVKNIEALANPQALDEFKNRPELS